MTNCSKIVIICISEEVIARYNDTVQIPCDSCIIDAKADLSWIKQNQKIKKS